MQKKLIPVFLFVVLVALLFDPARYFRSVQGGVVLFASSVLPSMLPYFFFTKLLTGTGCVGALSATVGKPVGKAYRVAPIAAYPLLMSFLAGYPVGARVLADLYDKKLISAEDVSRAFSFSSTSGSMFVFGSVGASILKDVRAAILILVCHYLGALINGFLYRGKKKDAPVVLLPPLSSSAEDLLSDAMYQSVLSLALVGGFLAVTNLLGDMAADLLCKVGLASLFSGGTLASGLLYGFFEVTRGCVEFSALALSRVWKTALCCLAVSFGGLSVILQSMAFLGKSGIKKGKVLLMKGSQAALSFLLCLGLGSLFL